MKNENKWLMSGKQSKITPRIRKISLKFRGNDLEKIYQVLTWIEKNISSQENHEEVLKIFASKTADEVIIGKKDTGCHDTALLSVTFLRAIGIPAKYLLGIDKEEPSKGGHCVVEAYVNRNWLLIDPSRFEINLIPNRSSFYRDNYLIKKGFDSWDCGVKTVKDWHNISNNLIKKIASRSK